MMNTHIDNIGSNHMPKDFMQYWQKQVDFINTCELAFTCTQKKFKNSYADYYDILFTSFDGE